MKKYIILMLLISFCTNPQANELYGSSDEVITLSESEDEIITASSSTTTTISSTTTTLANDYILHLEEITAEKIWLIDFTRRVNEAETEWNNLKITYQEYKEICSSFIKEAEEFNERVRGIDPPNKYDFLKVSQIDLNILSDIILDDTVELRAGVEEPDTGERTAAALSSFNINSELFVNKVNEIVRLSLSESTSLPPTTTTLPPTTTTLAPTTTTTTTTTTIPPSTTTTVYVDNTPPISPRTSIYRDDDIIFTNITSTSASLSWKEFKDDVGIAYYEIYYYWNGEIYLTKSETNQVDIVLPKFSNGVNWNRLWNIYIYAVDTSGNHSRDNWGTKEQKLNNDFISPERND